MSIYTRGEPVANDQFRRNTEKASMLNVRQIPARVKCVDCQRMRTEETGKYKRRGFVCGMCGRRAA